MKNKFKPVKVEQIYKTSIDKVWKAITEIDQMRLWFFKDIAEFRPETGFRTEFNVRVKEKDFLHQWELMEVIPFKKITYNWKYKGYSGDSIVNFELIDLNKKTLLQLTHTVIENFPNNIEEFSRKSCTAGWNYFIKESLKEFLA